MPVRVQRKRSRGWKMPENTVYVGRPSRWGNPFRVSPTMTATEAVDAFIEWVNEEEDGWVFADPESLAPLRGKNLACWCRLDRPCHADVLMELANR
jgi:hypothetical protein